MEDFVRLKWIFVSNIVENRSDREVSKILFLILISSLKHTLIYSNPFFPFPIQILINYLKLFNL